MKKMSLGFKLIVMFLAVGLIPFGIVGVTALVKSSTALHDSAFNQLQGVRGIKKARSSSFLLSEREIWVC